MPLAAPADDPDLAAVLGQAGTRRAGARWYREAILRRLEARFGELA